MIRFGQLGYRYVIENPEQSATGQNVGAVGHPDDPNNAPGVQIRGSTGFDFSSQSFETDYYTGSRSWWRTAVNNRPDDTPIWGEVDFSFVSGLLSPDRITAVLVTAYDHSNRSVASALDFVLGRDVVDLLGQELADLFEASDDDFLVTGSFEYDGRQIIGPAGNVAAISILGFQIDTAGVSHRINYSMDWTFV